VALQADVAGARRSALAHLVAAAGGGALDLVQPALGAVQVGAQARDLGGDLLFLGGRDAAGACVGDRDRPAYPRVGHRSALAAGEAARKLGARLLRHLVDAVAGTGVQPAGVVVRRAHHDGIVT
jgi:hypothetical protein